MAAPLLRQWIAPWLRYPTLRFLVTRLFQALLTLLLTSVFCFFIIQLAPGDCLDSLRSSPTISKERLAQLSQLYGLDLPLWQQYGLWLGNALRGDLGLSCPSLQPVAEQLWMRVPATLWMAIASILMTWCVAIPLGIWGAVKQNTWIDRLLQVLSYGGQGFPSFITALLLLFIAQQVSPLLPVGGMTSIDYDQMSWGGKVLDLLWHLILPTLALSLTSFAGLQRLTRGQLLDVLRQNYVQTARAKGLPESRVIYVHALRNAVNPLITLLGFEFASLLSGSFIAEYFFNWPGLGRLTLQAVQNQDVFLLMAALMMGAILLIVGNLLADFLLTLVDPRIQMDQQD